MLGLVGLKLILLAHHRRRAASIACTDEIGLELGVEAGKGANHLCATVDLTPSREQLSAEAP